MKKRIVLVCVLLLVSASTAFPQMPDPSRPAVKPATKAGTASIAGVWRGSSGGDAGALPAIILTVTNETGALSGAILFNFIRNEDGQKWTSTPGHPEPLIDPHFDGTTLTFQVSHRNAHPPVTLNDPPIHFRMTLVGADKGAMNNKDNPVGDGAATSGMPMLRADN